MVYVDCVRIAYTVKVAAQVDAKELYKVILLDYCLVCSLPSI